MQQGNYDRYLDCLINNPYRPPQQAPFNPSNPQSFVKKIFRFSSKSFICQDLINSGECDPSKRNLISCPSAHNYDEIFYFWQEKYEQNSKQKELLTVPKDATKEQLLINIEKLEEVSIADHDKFTNL